MRQHGTDLLLSATDLSSHLGCRHLTALNLQVAVGEAERPMYHDSTLEVLQKRGLEHERAYVEHLRSRGLSVVEMPDEGITEASIERTKAAMREGADAITQAALQSGRWRGLADVLLKVDKPSDLGGWSYEAVDTKLARETRGGTILQICMYSDILEKVQGVRPDFMHVVIPGTDYKPETYRVADYIAFYRRTRTSLEEAVTDPEAAVTTYPDPCPQCDICVWQVACDHRRRDDDHLCLVAGISKMQIRELQENGVNTLTAFAELADPPPFKPSRGSVDSLVRVRNQASVQLKGRREKKPVYEMLDFEDGDGLSRLPEPSRGDVFFDFEGDPFVGEAGREYLFGYILEERGQAAYRCLWGMTAVEEKQAFEQFVDEMMAHWERYSDFHIYHYGAYEPAAMKRLMGRYATREDEVDRLLRAARFVDLRTVVKQSVRASVEKYSIKDLEPFFGFERDVDLREANLHRHKLEHALELGDLGCITPEMRDVVMEYNRDDCASTERLRDWLEGLRRELIEMGQEVPRPELKEGDPGEELSEHQQKVRELMERLAGDVPPERGERSDEQQARWLLAQTLEFHRREGKAVWWEYFRLRDLGPEDMLDERVAISGLELVKRVGKVKRSFVDRYRYPPQECQVKAGDKLKTSLVEGGHYGTVEAIDPSARTIDIKKGSKTADVHAGTVFNHDSVPSGTLRDSIVRLGQWVAEHGVEGEGAHRVARDLLMRRRPRLRDHHGGDLQRGDEETLATARRLVLKLDGGILPIQGPPGCGKTYTGAYMICDLVKAGKKVGISAVGHRAIENLVKKFIKAAGKEGVDARCIQKVREETDNPSPGITETKDNGRILSALNNGEFQVAAGTAWLWAREEMAERVDVLFIDEAGQMSLANTLAMAQACRNLVLLGDPQQLEQPIQGSHPEGSDVSALEHILGEHKTMPRDRGLFLEKTWRLHPDVCRFTSELFYEERLQSKEGLDIQVLQDAEVFSGAGLWFVPVEHTGNRNASEEEVARVAELVGQLASGGVRWTNQDGETRTVGVDDIKVVAPYNAHVGALLQAVPNVAVGTVDKFQGQEAPILIYSMATSSPEEAPRGMEFLYNLSRLNVATSRARSCCILVANPRLLAAECRTPRQMKLANAFCRYVELAR